MGSNDRIRKYPVSNLWWSKGTRESPVANLTEKGTIRPCVLPGRKTYLL